MLIAALAAAATTAPAAAYRDPAAWLCRPGRADICARAPAVTVVDGNGAMRPAPARRTGTPGADCFYVYPTVSRDPGGNSDLIAGPEERGMTEAQFAPFRAVCRTFAPLYRQVTLTALRASFGGGGIPGDFDLAYRDVRAAWRDYLARDNHGRPFMLVGHSQGSLLLKRLIVEEIDGKPIQSRLLSAILPGTAILVPQDAVVGGDFRSIPLCRADAQTGCVVTWASYRDTAPPPANALFGVSTRAGMVAGCTNPARLGGGQAPLDSILGAPWWRGGVAQYDRPDAGWRVGARAVPTRFVAMPGLLSARCRVSGTTSYLAVHVASGVPQPLADTVASTGAIGDVAYPDWGFHVIDMAIVQGDLLRLVERQRAAYRPRR
ncbi:MAG TPA: DUF3089 domain-containing protein [Sphingomonas sp.]|jgi:hypothetical protein|uniref:DUF3089 domain-containing protein n=1 Tax=Sphingomonas sp. TaxID=28214 RepID=UPI002ED77762